SEVHGTPIVANLMSGVFSTLVMLLAMLLSEGNAGKYFAAVLGLAISTTTVSYIAVFPALVRLRRTDPDVPRPYRVPGGMAGAWICAGLTTFWALLATVVQLRPGFGVGWSGSGGNPDASLPDAFAHQRLAYELTQIVPLAGLLLISLALYAVGRRSR